jgi:hypothetical protein
MRSQDVQLMDSGQRGRQIFERADGSSRQIPC